MKTLILLVLAACSPLAASTRTWTSNDGRTIEGRPISKDATSVTVRRDSGQEVTIPFEMLSPECRVWAEKWKAPTFALQPFPPPKGVGIDTGIGSDKTKGWKFGISGSAMGRLNEAGRPLLVSALKRFVDAGVKLDGRVPPSTFRQTLTPEYQAGVRATLGVEGGKVVLFLSGTELENFRPVDLETASYLHDWLAKADFAGAIREHEKLRAIVR